MQAGCTEMLLLLALFPVLALGGCVTKLSVPNGARLYADHCAACHGPRGAGDGHLAARLPIAPADLRGLAQANGGAFPTGDVIAKVYGYRGQGQAALMPAFGTYLDGPSIPVRLETGQIAQAPAALVAVVKHVEQLSW